MTFRRPQNEQQPSKGFSRRRQPFIGVYFFVFITPQQQQTLFAQNKTPSSDLGIIVFLIIFFVNFAGCVVVGFAIVVFGYVNCAYFDPKMVLWVLKKECNVVVGGR